MLSSLRFPTFCCQAGYFVLEFYKDRIKKQSVKNFMLHNSRGQFIMQFGRSKEDNVFALDFTGPFSPLAAFGVALVRANKAFANFFDFWCGRQLQLPCAQTPARPSRLKANLTLVSPTC